MIERRVSTGDGRTWSFTGTTVKTLAPYAGMGLLLFAALALVGDDIGHHIRAIDSWIAGLGPWGALVFVGVIAVATSLFVPESVLAIMAGALFGPMVGLAAVAAGGLAAAILQYFASRRMLRSRIDTLINGKPHFLAIQRGVKRHELRLQVLLRLTPLNPTTLNLLFGAAGVRLGGFVLACLAMLPGQAIEVFFGYAGKHVAKIVGRSGHTVNLHDVLLIGGGVICILVVVLVSSTARKAVAEALADSDAETVQPEGPSP